MLSHRGTQRSLLGDPKLHSIQFGGSDDKGKYRPLRSRDSKVVPFFSIIIAVIVVTFLGLYLPFFHFSNNASAQSFRTLNIDKTVSSPPSTTTDDHITYQNFVSQSTWGNISIVSRGSPSYRLNAVVILAQKKHATYQRDSYGLLLQALDLLVKNYVSIQDHANSMDIFLFHTGDYTVKDLLFLEAKLSTPPGMLKLVNLNDTGYWTLPSWHEKDDRSDWIDYDIFPVAYRHMCRWFGIKLWDFFQELNTVLNCHYRYLLRIDEDSFLWSPIHYNIFNYMRDNQFVYGFRLCAYELEYNRRIAPWYNRWKMNKNNPTMKREIHRDLCAFYNNFFVADLQFFSSPPVQKYLHALDRQGFIYRKRYGDLMIHSTVVYAHAESTQIHRFLDFTYSHVTRDYVLHPEQGCVVWGGIQAGYNDLHAPATLDAYYQEYVVDRQCTANISYLEEKDLSPTYQHIPKEWKGKVKLKTIVAGKVELPGQGKNSG